jgi:hypothetical protein
MTSHRFLGLISPLLAAMIFAASGSPVSGAAAQGRCMQSVTLPGSTPTLAFEQQSDGLPLQLPEPAPGKFTDAFRITFDRLAR